MSGKLNDADEALFGPAIAKCTTKVIALPFVIGQSGGSVVEHAQRLFSHFFCLAIAG